MEHKDIVERLRGAAKPTRILDIEDLTKAADEIERLRQQLADVTERFTKAQQAFYVPNAALEATIQHMALRIAELEKS